MSEETGKTVWVLTREHNQYDQEGAYFECVFAEKPTLEQLAAYFKKGGKYFNEDSDMFDKVMEAVAFLEHLRGGGGRQEWEDVWYNLSETPLR